MFTDPRHAKAKHRPLKIDTANIWREAQIKTLQARQVEVTSRDFRFRDFVVVSGPKLVPGDTVILLNFSEKLNATSKILKGDVEREASVAILI